MKRVRGVVSFAVAALVATAATALRVNVAEAAGAGAGESTLETVATELARALGSGASHVPDGAKVVAASVVSDVAGTRGDELGARLAARVAAHLPKSSAEARTGDLSVAAAAAGRSSALVYLTARLVAGKLEVSADIYPSVGNSWDRVRRRAPQAVGHAFSSGRVDAEIHAFLPPILLEQATLRKAPLRLPEGGSEVLALGCGDADGDGNLDLVLSTRARLVTGRLRAGAFLVDRAVAWKDLAPRAPVVLREPVASFAFAPRFAAGTSDRGGVTFDDDLHRAASFAGLPVGGGACIRLDADATSFSGPASACVDGDATVAPTKLAAARYDGAVVGRAVKKDGSVAALTAARETGGKLRVGFRGSEEVLAGAGAAFAVGDLDLDGVPEVATSRNVPPGGSSDPASTAEGADVLQVSSLGALGTPRLKFPAPAGVRAIAVCPAEARAVPALVAIVGDEVWLVR